MGIFMERETCHSYVWPSARSDGQAGLSKTANPITLRKRAAILINEPLTKEQFFPKEKQNSLPVELQYEKCYR